MGIHRTRRSLDVISCQSNWVVGLRFVYLIITNRVRRTKDSIREGLNTLNLMLYTSKCLSLHRLKASLRDFIMRKNVNQTFNNEPSKKEIMRRIFKVRSHLFIQIIVL
jgi:phosphomannomutase